MKRKGYSMLVDDQMQRMLDDLVIKRIQQGKNRSVKSLMVDALYFMHEKEFGPQKENKGKK